MTLPCLAAVLLPLLVHCGVAASVEHPAGVRPPEALVRRPASVDPDLGDAFPSDSQPAQVLYETATLRAGAADGQEALVRRPAQGDPPGDPASLPVHRAVGDGRSAAVPVDVGSLAAVAAAGQEAAGDEAATRWAPDGEWQGFDIHNGPAPPPPPPHKENIKAPFFVPGMSHVDPNDRHNHEVQRQHAREIIARKAAKQSSSTSWCGRLMQAQREFKPDDTADALPELCEICVRPYLKLPEGEPRRHCVWLQNLDWKQEGRCFGADAVSYTPYISKIKRRRKEQKENIEDRAGNALILSGRVIADHGWSTATVDRVVTKSRNPLSFTRETVALIKDPSLCRNQERQLGMETIKKFVAMDF